MKNWKIVQSDAACVRHLCTALGCSPVVAALLANRGIRSPEAADRFLSPSFSHLSDPFTFKEMDKAVSRIDLAIQNQEKILIFGDYDADGITASVLLTEFLSAVGADVSYYIPHRETEGYGLKPEHITGHAAVRRIHLIITVDCGSSSHEAVRQAAREGIDVIITDHHTISDPLPEALAVINPKRGDCPSGAGYLAGVGVAFFLVVCLRKHLRERGFWSSRPEPNLKNVCDLVALGTIADVVPLTGSNRILVKGGIEMIQTGSRPGIQSLVEISGIEANVLNADDIAFKLAPRLNAAGRMAHAETAVQLLLDRNAAATRDLADTLNMLNSRRRSIEQRVLDGIRLKIENSPELLEAGALVMADDSWPLGVLGIVASRLVQELTRPVVLIATRNGSGRGSARSVPGFDLYSELKSCADCLSGFGGHAAAAGLEIATEKIAAFRERFGRLAEMRIGGSEAPAAVFADAILDIGDITPSLIDEIATLQPFGSGNPEPVFLAENIQVVTSAIAGRNTLRLMLKSGTRPSGPVIAAVQFNTDTLPAKGSTLPAMAYRLRWNHWNGQRNAQILIEDTIFSLQSPMSEIIIKK